MAVAAAEFFGHPSRELTVAGVTGTNGKTTTTFLLFAILAAAGLRPGLLGTVETRIGGERRPAVRTTPEAIDLQRTLREMLDAGDRSCALEATSHGSELRRLDGTRFAVLVFTNLSQDHLDLHGTMERYFEAKRRLFLAGDPPRPPSTSATPTAGGSRTSCGALGRAPLVTFALDTPADVRGGARARCPRSPATAAGIEIETPLLGRFNVENVLGAVAAARLLDLADEAVAQGIASVRGVPGRFEPVDEGQPFLVVVDYSHTPDSLENALRTARELADGRVDLRLRLRRRPRPGQAAADGSGRGDSKRRRDRHLRQPAQRGSGRDHPRGPRGRRPARSRSSPTGARRSRGRSRRAAAGRRRRSSPARATSRARSRRAVTVPFDDRQVAREALRRLGARA